MSETSPIEERDPKKEDLVTADPARAELQGGGTDDEHERNAQREVEENVEAELDDRLQSHDDDRL